MDPQMGAYLGALLATILGLAIALIVMYKTAKPPERLNNPQPAEDERAPAARGQQNAQRAGLGRMRAAAAAAVDDNDADGNDNQDDNDDDGNENVDPAAGVEAMLPGGKKGKKYLQKQQRKEELRKEREALEQMRRKKKEEEEQELAERKEQRAAERAEQKRLEEQLAAEEEQRRKELEKKQAEEAAFWRKEMQVVAEGNAQIEAQERAKAMALMADHVRRNKVVLLEDLSSLFSMRTNDVISCLKQLESEGAISGVIDDRGKYIYILPDELDAVARFIKKRGRVSIEELAAESNRLINLSGTELPAPAAATAST